MRKILYLRIFLGLALLAAAGPAAAGPRKAAPSRISPLSDSIRKTVKTPAPAAKEAFRNFKKKTGANAWRVRYSPKTALPEAIVGAKTTRYPGSPAEAALAFLNDNRELLKVDAAQLRQAYSKAFMGVTHIQYYQIYNSVPVEFAYVRVHINSSGEVTGYQAKFEPDINVPLTPAYPASYAANIVISDLGFAANVTDEQLVLFPDPASDGALKLAWKVRARAADVFSGIWVYYVGAADGRILFRYNDLRSYYNCPADGGVKATGTVSATVYDISPVPTDPNLLGPGSWTPPVSKPVTNQYVWVGGYTASTRTVDGTYCAAGAGKVFASLKGPYFSVVNFRGRSAHFDNGGGVWRTAGVGAVSPNPYANSQTYPYSVTVTPDDWTAAGDKFAKVMPEFVNMSVGSMDNDGNVTDGDELHITNAAGNKVASYIGTRTSSFFGAPVESPSYGLTLKTDAAGVSSGFRINISSYLVLPSANAPATSANATGSIVWSTNSATVYLDKSLGPENALSENNAFYHLNRVKNYFDQDNASSGFLNIDPLNTSHPHPADLSGQVPVMVHAHGAVETMIAPQDNGMKNAFYDLEYDNIMIGDGPFRTGVYRSMALDGTIVRHEYVHRVVNRIYPIINFGEFGAMSEAVADYFALASFWREFDTEGGTAEKNNLSILGNFLTMPRDIKEDKTNCNAVSGKCSMPTHWRGEVHDDSAILSQALYTLRKDPVLGLGNFAGHPAYGNLAKTDVFTYAALFYFPDNFANFYDAFVEVCEILDPGCPDEAKIISAFGANGVPNYMAGADIYDTTPTGALCENNNGPECASDISALYSVSATIFPEGDADYYTLPLSEGNFTATLNLPSAGGSGYYAYTLFLFDANRKNLAIVEPVISNTDYGTCPDDGDCLTNSSAISLNHRISSAGRYYLMVSGAMNYVGGNSRVNSGTPYTLTLSYTPKGSARAAIATATFDKDTISFSVPYAKFPMVSAPSSETLTGAESYFQYAQLRDHNFQPIALARTDIVGGYLTVPTAAPAAPAYTTDSGGNHVISGTVNLSPGFASRYPGVGTVYLEVFGRNHMGDSFSLGVSNAFNLTTNVSDIVTYNNILGPSNGQAIIKYDVLSAGDLSIKIYTVTGSLVKVVHDGAVPAGKGTMDWDGTNEKGSKVASGIYYIKAKGPDLDKVDKIAVVR